MQDFMAWASAISVYLGAKPIVHITKYDKEKRVVGKDFPTTQPDSFYLMICKFLIFSLILANS